MLDCNLKTWCYKATIRWTLPFGDLFFLCKTLNKIPGCCCWQDSLENRTWVHSGRCLLDEAGPEIKQWKRSETRKASLLLAIWHRQSDMKCAEGRLPRVSGDFMFCKWCCTAAGEGKGTPQTLALSGKGKKMKGEKYNQALLLLLQLYITYST